MFKSSLTIEADLNRHFSRYEDPLWDDELEQKTKHLRVKIERNKNGFNIVVLQNNEIMYKVSSDKLNKKQADFLQTGDGLQFVLSQFKLGVKNISGLKKAMSTRVE